MQTIWWKKCIHYRITLLFKLCVISRQGTDGWTERRERHLMKSIRLHESLCCACMCACVSLQGAYLCCLLPRQKEDMWVTSREWIVVLTGLSRKASAARLFYSHWLPVCYLDTLLLSQSDRNVSLEISSHRYMPGPGGVYLICRPGTSTQGEKKKITGNLSEH